MQEMLDKSNTLFTGKSCIAGKQGDLRSGFTGFCLFNGKPSGINKLFQLLHKPVIIFIFKV